MTNTRPLKVTIKQIERFRCLRIMAIRLRKVFRVIRTVIDRAIEWFKELAERFTEHKERMIVQPKVHWPQPVVKPLRSQVINRRPAFIRARSNC